MGIKLYMDRGVLSLKFESYIDKIPSRLFLCPNKIILSTYVENALPMDKVMSSTHVKEMSLYLKIYLLTGLESYMEKIS